MTRGLLEAVILKQERFMNDALNCYERIAKFVNWNRAHIEPFAGELQQKRRFFFHGETLL
jgi:hypothetical protein